MELNPLTAVSPIDGRYHKSTEVLSDYFSEYALIKKRVFVEVEYFIELCKVLPGLKNFPKPKIALLQKACYNFSISDAVHIKEIEASTNHDVKAVEYFLREKFDELKLGAYKEYIHFGLTSQDINNTALPLLVKEAYVNILLPAINKILDVLITHSIEWKDVSMLARTHGQPASPTKLGKEIMVFAERIMSQLEQMEHLEFEGKFGGATGNFNAHYAAFPKISWHSFADKFTNRLGLKRQQFTTQIEHYDNLAAFFDLLKRINTILTDLCRDMWLYISMDYFKQEIVKNEVGSSAMPHKINPIDFENAEGNFGVANALFEHLSAKLPVSRLQRDLTDSTVTRNIGVPIAHTLIATNSLNRGLGKLILNQHKIAADLEKNWAVVAEAIQTILRRENYPNPYLALKELTRNNKEISKQTLYNFIEKLKISSAIKKELKSITPENYTGK
ncbi:MAG: adenylosuccinate lyase [Bacteroidales bacterium]|jgi:adenylosuccinate lyase|nr:adenylosuccinate lyase [Bacteroidales bacterium]MDD4213729.1 adenylosuccinate lyase [Bacteroidales bacterium]